MQTKWSDWLAAERAARRGGVILDQAAITRGQAYALALPLPGNLTGATFTAGLFADEGDETPLASFTASLGAYDAAAGTTLLTLSLPGSATGSTLPADADGNGVAEVVFKMDVTIAGVTSRSLSLVIPIVE
jgi:hypothetical protein